MVAQTSAPCVFLVAPDVGGPGSMRSMIAAWGMFFKWRLTGVVVGATVWGITRSVSRLRTALW